MILCEPTHLRKNELMLPTPDQPCPCQSGILPYRPECEQHRHLFTLDVRATKQEGAPAAEQEHTFESYCALMDVKHPDWRKGNHHGATSLTAVAQEFWEAAKVAPSPAQEKPVASAEVGLAATAKLHGVLHEHDLWGYGHLISTIEAALATASPEADTKRLDWMCHHCTEEFFESLPDDLGYARRAIDAAMASPSVTPEGEK